MFDTPTGPFAPLRTPIFRRIWLASLVSNLGLLIQGVGAAWAMTLLTDRADMIALVQSAFLIPIMLFAIPAGALADMFDRRLIGLISTGLSFSAAVTLTIISFMGWLNPTLILLMTFLLGTGMALFGPSWQASAGEQVPPPMLPAAIALNSISYNVGRSFGPAIGGLIVASLGAAATFVINALFYIPLMIVLYFWRRPYSEPRLPPERIDRAIISGVRYVMHAPSIRAMVVRTALTGLAGGCVPALMPLMARDVLTGGASTYGFLLGAYGVGSVLGAAQVAKLRRRFTAEALIRWCAGGQPIPAAVSAPAADHRRRLDDRPDLFQRIDPDGRAALGHRPGARDLPVGDCRRHGRRQLDVGPCRQRLWHHPRFDGGRAAAARGTPARPVVEGRRSRYGPRIDRRAGDRRRTVADRTQRAYRRRNRLCRGGRQCPPLLYRHAEGPGDPAAQWRLWLVAVARAGERGAMDRAVPLPDLARLSAHARPHHGP
jgi:MFS family permease